MPDEPGETGHSEVARARSLVARRYGSAVAEKATERFLLAHGLPSGARESADAYLAFESFRGGSGLGPSVPTVPTVLTFTRSEPSAAARESVDRLRSRLPEAGDLAPPALRQAFIRARREAAYAQMGAVYTEVERLSERSWVGRASPASTGPLTEVCWLSRSLRTRAHPSVVADIVADPKVVAVDVPERLRREAAGPPTVVGAVDARTRLGVDGRDVLVAVIDGEVARDHPAFGDRIVQRRNHTSEMWGSPDKHGTAVAGIIGAGEPNPGMAPGCAIYCYKVFASLSALSSDRFDGERALQSALEDGAHVANCSWAVESPPPGQPATMLEAVNDAWAGGMVIVKSAGNGGAITYPGEAGGVLVVGTTTPDGTAVPAESGHSRDRPHVVAPGGAPGADVSSTLVGGGFGPVGWGTSYAAPVVTGAVTLLLAAEPTLTPDQIRDRIVSTAAPVGDARRLDLRSW